MAERPGRTDKVLLQVRVARPLLREVDHFAVDEDLWRAEAVDRLLRAGLEVLKKGGGRG